MTADSKQETKSQGPVKGAGRSLAQDVGLNHEAGPSQEAPSLTQTIRRLFGRIPRTPRKSS